MRTLRIQIHNPDRNDTEGPKKRYLNTVISTEAFLPVRYGTGGVSVRFGTNGPRFPCYISGAVVRKLYRYSKVILCIRTTSVLRIRIRYKRFGTEKKL